MALYIEAIRIKIAILLVGLVISFIFYPIYLFDKRNSTRISNAEKIKISKILTPEVNESEKDKDYLIIIEKGSKTQDDTEKKIDIICDFCGKKMDEYVKVCPYCGTEL